MAQPLESLSFAPHHRCHTFGSWGGVERKVWVRRSFEDRDVLVLVEVATGVWEVPGVLDLGRVLTPVDDPSDLALLARLPMTPQ